ncbi:MAG TPA: ABC transporter substrate-binding protein [Hyphomicrobiales bacterium]|nr:ABC transporter substrate-binding protein [Hyphomicrobiales bacterium]
MKRIRGLSSAAAAAALAFMLLPGSAMAQQKTVIHVSSIPIIDTAPLEAAKKEGYFAAEGLEVDTTPTAGGAVGIPALLAGQVQFASSNTISVAIAADKGLGIKLVSAGSDTGDNPPDLAALVAAPGSHIKSGKDLEGKRLAVNTRLNIIWLYANAWVQKTGGDPTKVTYVEVPFPQMIDAVKNGQVAAAFAIEPFLSAALAAKSVEFVGWPYNAVQKSIPVSGYVATDAYVKAHPDIVKRWVRAYDKGVDWVNAHMNTPAFAELVSGYTKMPVKLIQTLHLPPYRKTIEPERLNPQLDLMRQFHLISDKVTAATLLTDTAMHGVK